MTLTAGQQKKVEEAIALEFSLHSQAHLKDLYKNFFQDHFGPGHLIGNPDKALDYLVREINESTLFDKESFHYLGYNHNFVRVNLKLVKDNIIPLDEFFSLFLESTGNVSHPTIEQWISIWNGILKRIKDQNLNLPEFDNECLEIDDNLKKGVFVGHHSEAYEQLYHPHYRIISSSIVDKIRNRYHL